MTPSRNRTADPQRRQGAGRGLLARLHAFLADRCGSVAVEMGLVFPALLVMLGAFAEVGRAYVLSEEIEKGLRAGALYLARTDDPRDAARWDEARNLVRTGTLDGSGPTLAGLAPEAVGDPEVYGALVGGRPTWVVRFAVEVPYRPMLPGLAKLAGLDGLTIALAHEQPHVGR